MHDEQPRARTVRLETPTGPGDFAYDDHGPEARAVDVLFLNANGFNARAYRSILSPLAAEGVRILAMDLRGHGRTTAPAVTEGRTSWLDLADDVTAFIEALDLTNLVAGGHSMGGALSLFAAAAAPERIKALALFDPVVRAGEINRAAIIADSPLVAGAGRRRRHFASREAAVAAYRGRGAFTNWTEAMLSDYVADGFRDRPDGTVELACTPEWEVSNYVSQDHDAWSGFAATRCPIRILAAQTGSTFMPGDKLSALTADGRITVETVPGTTHFLPMERPDLVRETLRRVIGG